MGKDITLWDHASLSLGSSANFLGLENMLRECLASADFVHNVVWSRLSTVAP